MTWYERHRRELSPQELLAAEMAAQFEDTAEAHDPADDDRHEPVEDTDA